MRIKLQTTGQKIISGSKEQPLDIIVQNLSANTVYVALDNTIDNTGQGAKVTSGQSYTNSCLSGPLWALADVADSEIDVEIQPSWLALCVIRRY